MDPSNLILPTLSPSLTTKNLSLSTSLLQKAGKAPIPRIEVEPIYTQLKGALGNQWNDYKAAIGAFILGNLNQAELAWVLQPLLSILPTIITPLNAPTSILQLHNQLVACIYANTSRDPPPTDVAPWVVATDKPSTTKNAATIGASDKAEERLKREIMALHPRDRRRIKALKANTVPRQEGGLKDMQDYRYELLNNSSDRSAPSAADIAKTTSDMETRRKYVLPLASETLEFPSQSDMQNRIEPICHDEGLISSNQGILQSCAELLEQAAEAYLKSVLGGLQTHVRSNAVDCVQTSKYKQQLEKEENEVERGLLQRSSVGLLPVEMEVQAKREPLSEASLLLALELRDPAIHYNRFLSESTRLNQWPVFHVPLDSWTTKHTSNADDMEVDEEMTWQGSTTQDQEGLMNILDECLAVA